MIRFDPKSPKRMSIGTSGVSFGPRSEGEEERLEKWAKIWAEFPPGIYEHSTKAYQETDKGYFKEGGHKGGKKQEL